MTRPLRFIIDATQQEAHITGTDRLAYNVLKELQELDTVNHYTVMCTRGFDYVPSAVTAPNFNVVEIELFRGYWKLTAAPFRLLRLLRRKYIEKPDLFFSFHNMNVPRVKFSPVVSSALDLIPLIYGETYHRNAAAAVVYESRLKRACKVADHFVAISDYTKQDLIKHLNVPSSKITVMHLAADQKFTHQFTAERKAEVRKKYRLPVNFVLTIGANEPRKNAAGVIEAFRLLPAELQAQNSLVILGKEWNKQKIEEFNDLPVLFTGFADDEDLPVMYSLAACFVFLSTYEGFGMPILEAMACGTPVVSANNTSLPEVAGDAALMVDASKPQEASSAIQSILVSRELREKLSRAGLDQAQLFTWRKTATVLLEVFMNIAGKGRK